MAGTFKTLIAILLALVALFSSTNAQHPTRLVYQYSHKGTWLENGAVRQNGSILLTSLNNPGGLHSLNPFDGSAPAFLANDFDYLNSTLGIVETVPDTFYVIASNFSLSESSLGTQEGTNAIYRVELTKDCDEGSAPPTVSLLAKLPDAKFLNGLTKFNDSLLLATDSELGLVWSISTESGATKTAAKDPLMNSKPTNGYGEGINGAHFRDGTLFFSNSQQQVFGKAVLDHDAKQKGPAAQIATPVVEKGLTPNWDDFAVDESVSFAYIATEAGNSVQRINLQNGNVEVFAGNVNGTAIAEPAAVRFGRTLGDSDVIYVMTTGGLGFPVHTPEGAKQIGAQVVAVNVG